MSTLGEHKGNGNPTETSLQREGTKEQIDDILRNFDVLPSSFDRFIFKYISVYLIGLLIPCELGIILSLEALPNAYLRGSFGTVDFLPALSVVAFLSIIWPYKAWRLSAPKTLRDLYEKKCIALPDDDANTSYLRLLEHYRDSLGSPKRYFLSGSLIIVLAIFGAYTMVSAPSVVYPSSFVTILGTVTPVLLASETLGGLYCFGIVIWTIYTSGWYARKLVRAFDLRIQPFHPDQCGGLKLLGTFCFGFVLPAFIGSGLNIGYILFSFSVGGTDAISLAIKVGFPLLLLLFIFLVIVLAFILPLWDIHTKLVGESERNEDTYAVRITALREEIQSLLDSNQVEEAKAVQEKKAMVESLYTPYPTWPFHVRSKIFSTVLGVSGSLLIGLMAAALQQYLLPAILTLFFHNP